MNQATLVIDKRRRIEQQWKKLRGTKIGTPEYEAIVNEIGNLSMEYHQLIEIGRHPTQINLLHSREIT